MVWSRKAPAPAEDTTAPPVFSPLQLQLRAVHVCEQQRNGCKTELEAAKAEIARMKMMKELEAAKAEIARLKAAKAAK